MQIFQQFIIINFHMTEIWSKLQLTLASNCKSISNNSNLIWALRTLAETRQQKEGLHKGRIEKLYSLLLFNPWCSKHFYIILIINNVQWNIINWKSDTDPIYTLDLTKLSRNFNLDFSQSMFSDLHKKLNIKKLIKCKYLLNEIHF